MDMWAKAEKYGNGWYGIFKTPGRAKRVVCKDGSPVRFDTRADALQAASDTLCHVFRDTTTGWRSQGLTPQRASAERAFRRLQDG